jgi:hypothetical protein
VPGRVSLPWARGVAVLALVLGAAACPLPFQFSRQGWAGNASEADPSTPEITSIPRLVYTQASGSGGTVLDGGIGCTVSDTSIGIVTDTPGAVIFYTTNGSEPALQAQADTSRYTPGALIPLAIAGPTPAHCATRIEIKAIAIGPNKKPSPAMDSCIDLAYLQAEAVVFTPPEGTYSSDQSLQMSSPTPGAEIYYTIVAGGAPAPAPVPGQPGTLRYAAPIQLNGPVGSWSVSASARAAQMVDSLPASALYSIACDGPTGLQIWSGTSTSLHLGWDPMQGDVYKYVLQRSKTPSFATFTELSSLTPSCTDTGLEVATTYYYRVQAEYTAGSTAFSAAVSGTTLDQSGMPLVVPVTLPGPYKTPDNYNTYFGTDSYPHGLTNTGPSLKAGGYTYIPYGHDLWSNYQVTLVAFDSNSIEVARWLLPGTRYVYDMTVSGGIVTIWGQADLQGVPTTASIAWSVIAQ